jgi:hypothetical protein
MNRVIKRTFYKLAVLFGSLFGLMVYGVTCALLGKYFFGKPDVGMFLGLAAGGLTFVVYASYKSSKEEVRYENEKLILQIKREELNKKLGL